MKLLFNMSNATDKEAKSKTQKQIREDASEDGCLDDWNQVAFFRIFCFVLVPSKQHQEEYDLHNATQCGLNQDTADLW